MSRLMDVEREVLKNKVKLEVQTPESKNIKAGVSICFSFDEPPMGMTIEPT